MKYQKNTTNKIIIIAFVIIQIFLLTGISATAIYNNEDNPYADDTVSLNSNYNSDTVYNYNANNSIDLTLPDLTFAVNNTINTTLPSARITFDATNIVDYSFDTEGITAIESQSIPMEFDLIASEEFGTFEITAERTDGTFTSKTLYAYNNGSKIYYNEKWKIFD